MTCGPWRHSFGALALIMSLASVQASAAEFFALSDVKLLDGPFLHAMQLNRDQLLSYDPDRLLAPFLTEAGLPAKAQRYGNWEDTGLGGQTAGHYLSALAITATVMDDQECRDRLDYMVAELARCQQANGDGYVGGVENSKRLWDDIARGKIDASGFSLNGRWVPWYNLHKTFQGLRDAWQIAGNEQARDVFIGLSEWCADLASKLSDQQIQQTLISEHGGMCEVLADAAVITGDDKYVELAKRFSHRQILDPLAKREDRLSGLHANTQVPKVVGFEQIAQLSGDESYHTAAEFFWRTVTSTRSVALGGNSISEHFPSPGQSIGWIERREGPETCNTYNMLRLTKKLFEAEPKTDYADFAERAIYNHILSSQHPQHGGYVYFTPLRPRHYRVYSQVGECFWCCVGTGMENHGKYGELVYAHDGDDLYVNLFMPTELHWQKRGLRVRQTTEFPMDGATHLSLQLDKPQQFTIYVRHPKWVSEGFEVKVNGQPFEVDSQAASYAAIDRKWQDGDKIDVSIPLKLHTESLPYLDEYVALLHGPILLAAPTSTDDLDGLIAGSERMGHIALGPLRPVDATSMLIGDKQQLVESIESEQDGDETFIVPASLRPEGLSDIELVPFYRVHDTRYTMYWHLMSADEYKAEAERLQQEEQARLAFDRRTVDRVVPGEQQPESDHNLQSQNSSTGSWQDRPFRHSEGWFSYDMKSGGERQLELQVTYFGSDRRQFDILVNDELLQSVDLQAPKPNEFVDVRYAIPAGMLQAAPDGKLVVKFAAKPGSMAGGIYDVRLLKPAEE